MPSGGNSGGFGGGAAPGTAQYLVLSADTTLTVERVFTASTGLSGVDSGAGAAYTLSIDSTVATLTGSQTLTNKTLTTPTIGDFTNATHTHQTIAAGGTLDAAAIAAGTLVVARGGTGLTAGTSGGVLGYTATGTLASSIALTANALVLGGGAGATPIPMGSLGTTTTVLHGNAAGAPTFAAVSLSADVTGTLPVANGGTGLTSGTSGGILGYTATGTIASSIALTASALVLGGGAGATPTPMGSLGTTTTVLHGNAGGAPTFAAVSLSADVTGNLPVTNLNSGTSASSSTFWRGDATWATPAATGNTLDQSYDQGGAGVGRTITVDSGPVSLTGGGTPGTIGLLDIIGSQTMASGASIQWRALRVETDITLTGSTDVTTSTGFNMIEFNTPTITDGGTITSITNAATVRIAGAPNPIGLTITNGYALWVDSGVTRLDGQLLGADGTAGAPGLSFSTDTNTGIARLGSDWIALVAGGVSRVDIDTAQVYCNVGLSVLVNGSGGSPAVNVNSLAGLFLVSSTHLGFSVGGASRGFITNTGSWVLQTAALATTATDGFTYIPTCAGAPTGTPTARTGTVAMIFDTTNNKLMIYDGAWIGIALV